MDEQAARPLAPRPPQPHVLLPGQALRARPATLARVAALLGGAGAIALAEDDGADIALGAGSGSWRFRRSAWNAFCSRCAG